MWIFINDAFFSIVKSRTRGHLLVRARAKGDIERVFGMGSAAQVGAPVEETPEADYRFRVSLPNRRVSSIIEGEVLRIDYTNFKDSIHDNRYHDACLKVWSAMHRYQSDLVAVPKLPRGRGKKGGRR
jgi:hypothetical protein